MGQLVNGTWIGGDAEQIGARGWEPRKEGFRGMVSAAQAAEYPAEPERYVLVECPGCPLAQRVSIVHRIKRLDHVVPTVSVRPEMGAHGRVFAHRAGSDEALAGFDYLYEAYLASDPAYTGRASTPVLWDRKTRRIVSNNTRDIFAMFNGAFDALTTSRDDFLPQAFKPQIDAEIERIYATVTSTVYKCGFARDQAVYDENLAALEDALDAYESRLAGRAFLVSESPTEADWMLYTSLIRFDAIYVPLFRTTTRRIADMPALTAYLARLHAIPRVAETFDLPACMAHYFRSHRHINPTGIIPAAPALDWLNRDVDGSRPGLEPRRRA